MNHLDEQECRSTLNAVLKIKGATMETIKKNAHRNIQKVQKKQKYHDRRHNTSNEEQLSGR